MLGKDFLRRPRLSRIYYRGRFFDYPLKPLNALRNLGLWTSFRVALSCLWIKLFPIRPERSFADWVSNRFGRMLFHIFFETYTEKVWGIPCNRIGAQWAAQRIKGLSLKTAVINMLVPAALRGGGSIKSLIEHFEYPAARSRDDVGRLPPANRTRRRTSEAEQPDYADSARRFAHNGRRGGARRTHLRAAGGARHLDDARAPSVQRFDPPAPAGVVEAASRLKYRDFLTVALIIDQAQVFPDNWIYVHDDRVRVGRIQNYKNWSPDMVPDARFTCLGLEYFCFAGDGLWSKSDAELVELATRELEAIGLAAPGLVRDGTVVRAAKAYPVYDEGYEAALLASRQFLEGFSNLQLVGRNGMHKYNNQDHSMLTAMLAVRNLFGERHCLWDVNADEEYHEEETIEPEAPHQCRNRPPHWSDAARRSALLMTAVERRALPPEPAVRLSVSVIVPFHQNLHQLSRCLSSLLPLPPRTEIIVAADRAPRECDRVAWRHGARVIQVTGPGGPAAARNQAVSASRSDVLIFIDADVVVPSAALHAMVREFSLNPTMAAVFGTYDDNPGCSNFFSQYKNLAHAFVHRASGRTARSFWAGFGGMRAEVFHSVGGFDEAFTRPCIEDIELGDRVTAAGHRVLIDRRLHACHLKRWTFRSMLASDIWDRGVPWTQLVLSSRRVQGLNLGVGPGVSVALSYASLLCLALAYWRPGMLIAAVAALGLVLFLNRKQYAFFLHHRGAWFACRAAAMNVLYHLYNGFSFAVGAAIFLTQRRGAVPQDTVQSDSSDQVAMR